MTREGFKLEIVRPGPLHGQLLSRLTNYIALCDGVEADTVRLPFDHYELKADLEALRYTVGSDGYAPIPNPLRAAAVERLSQRVTGVMEQMRGFQTRIAEAVGAEQAHLRLVLGGGELALIPFEILGRPPGWPGTGGRMSLQSRPCLVVTREQRDSSRWQVKWDRPPRILFCTASPSGFARPPVDAHLLALTQAVMPWVAGGRRGGKEIGIRDVITVLPDASLDSIAEAASNGEYTHVHLLCHGVPIPGEDYYGLALARPGKPQEVEPVKADALAQVLRGIDRTRPLPTMVVLASCDSANQASVEAPGASVAYELHRHGVPWVVASQMPLTYAGSATLARVLYDGLFCGLEPLTVLSRTRAELARDAKSHDWASIAVYASFPPEFDAQVRAFRIRQIRARMDAAFQRAKQREDNKACENELRCVDKCIGDWQQVLDAAAPNEHDQAELEGTRGTVAKQKAEIEPPKSPKIARYLEEARHWYKKAAEREIGSHWGMVQFLSLSRVLNEKPGTGWYEFAEHVASTAYDRNDENKIWCISSLMEIAILSDSGVARGKSHTHWAEEFANQVVSSSDFPYFSATRQLRRYVDNGILSNEAMADVRKRAEEALKKIRELKPPPD